MNSTLTAVQGFLVGHAQDLDGATGCTVVICPPGTVGAVDQRGGAPGTRETDLLRPSRLVKEVDAILLAGGSAFGLAAAEGVVRWLEERGRGFRTAAGPVPIVPAAVLYDLEVGDAKARPDARMGRAACETASGVPVAEGSLGAGTGCRVGSLRGTPCATKGGIGSAAISIGSDTGSGALIVAALFAVNALGDIVDASGSIVAGLRESPGSPRFVGTLPAIARGEVARPLGGTNTVIGVVATNARLDREALAFVAGMAQDGIARAVRPAHTMFDGDTIFALATGKRDADVTIVGAHAAAMTEAAIRRGVLKAESLAGVPAAGALSGQRDE